MYSLIVIAAIYGGGLQVYEVTGFADRDLVERARDALYATHQITQQPINLHVTVICKNVPTF
jgi:hypothetical protein